MCANTLVRNLFVRVSPTKSEAPQRVSWPRAIKPSYRITDGNGTDSRFIVPRIRSVLLPQTIARKRRNTVIWKPRVDPSYCFSSQIAFVSRKLQIINILPELIFIPKVNASKAPHEYFLGIATESNIRLAIRKYCNVGWGLSSRL